MSLKGGPGTAANAIFESDKQDQGLLLNGTHLQIPQQHQNRYLSHGRDIQGRLPKARTFTVTRKDDKSDDRSAPYLARLPRSSYQPRRSRTHTRPSERPWGPYM